MMACLCEQPEVVKLLIAAKAEIDVEGQVYRISYNLWAIFDTRTT
jgi:hypothetical protein